MEDKLLAQHSSVTLSSQFLKVRNYMWERRNLWRTTLECNGAFFFSLSYFCPLFNIAAKIRYNLVVDISILKERKPQGSRGHQF